MRESFDESEAEEMNSAADFRTHLSPVDRLAAIVWLLIIALWLLPWLAGFGIGWAVVGCALAAFGFPLAANVLTTLVRRISG